MKKVPIHINKYLKYAHDNRNWLSSHFNNFKSYAHVKAAPFNPPVITEGYIYLYMFMTNPGVQ